MRFENRADRFFLGRIDKRAGVDDEHVSLLRARCNFHPALQNAAEHDFSIDKIFCATEADHADFGAHFKKAAGLIGQ